jgi:integrase
VTFGAFARRWLAEYAAVEVSPTTALEYKSVLENHLLDAFGELALPKLTREHIRKLRAALAETRKPKTVNNIVQVAKTILNTAVEWNTPEQPLISANPWAGVPDLEVDEQAFDYWTEQERDRFLSAARFVDPRFTEVCLVALHTGMRLGELRALTTGQLDFERRQVCVRASYSNKTGQRYERTKTRRVGYVPMNDHAHRVLYKRVLFSANTLVFDPDVLRGPVAKLARLAKLAGVRPIRFHDLRHTFASNLVMAGVDVFTVSKLMRHASVSQTMRYAHLAPDYLKSEVGRISSGTDLAPITAIVHAK